MEKEFPPRIDRSRGITIGKLTLRLLQNRVHDGLSLTVAVPEVLGEPV